MWKITTVLLTVVSVGHAASNMPEDTDGSFPPQQMQQTSTQSYMMLAPAARAADFQQAFEILKKEKTAGKVYIQLADGSRISNVIDMNLMSNSTLVLFRYNSPQGILLQLVRVEEIQTIGY
jgi:hypothetical protein